MSEENVKALDVTVQKRSKKEFLIGEAKEILEIVVYLATSLSVLATIKSLVLVQQGINDFAHGYTMALVLALGGGKAVVLAQKLPILKALDHKPLIWSMLYKSVFMTIVFELAIHMEERIFPPHPTAAAAHPILLMVTHQIVLMAIFIILFTVRGFDKAIGEKRLFKIMFNAPEEISAQPGAHE